MLRCKKQSEYKKSLINREEVPISVYFRPKMNNDTPEYEKAIQRKMPYIIYRKKFEYLKQE